MKRILLLTTLIATGLAIAAPMAEARGRDGERGGHERGMGMQDISFADLDADGNGSLSAEELGLAALGQARFAKVDANGDGELTQEEILAASEARDKARREERAAGMIKRFDADENGTISLEEMANARAEKSEGKMAKYSAKMFGRMDTDEDGTVSEQEFEAAKAFMEKRGGKWGRKGHGYHSGD